MSIPFEPKCGDRELRTEFRKFRKHFDNKIGRHIIDWVNNEVLGYSRYIFTKRRRGIQYGYCTHCRKEYETRSKFGRDLKHKQYAVCPKCKSECIVRASGISRAYLIDSAYVVYYEKSKANPEAIVARGFHVSRDYRKDYVDIDTKFSTWIMYLFEPGNPQTWENYWHGFVPMRSSVSLCPRSQMYSDCSIESIRTAIEGTPYQYSTWDQHAPPQIDYVRFFELYSKYPCVEYLTKIGLKYFVSAKLYGLKTFGAINWNGKTIEQVLRMSKHDIREIKSYLGMINPLVFWLYQRSRKDKNRPSVSEINASFENVNVDCSNELKVIMRHATIKQIAAYLQKQMNRRKKKNETTKMLDIVIAWKDYLLECQELEFDLNNERIVFPSDLFAAHRRTSKQVVAKQNKELDENIKKRMKKLSKYFYEENDLFIRPARSTYELIHEGKLLNICVGTYAEKYGNGETIIMFVRRKESPNEPYITVEVKHNDIWQAQGKDHCSPDDHVKKFLTRFKEKRLNPKSKMKDGVAV